MTLTLVEEKRERLKYLTRGHLTVIILGQLFLVGFFVIPLVPENMLDIILLIEAFLLPILFVLFFLSFFKYKLIGSSDYTVLGDVEIQCERITITVQNEIKVYIPKDSQIEFLYDYVRGLSSNGMGNVHRGINELKINDNVYSLLIDKIRQVEELRTIFSKWYNDQIKLSEFTKDANRNRLIRLSPKFEWNELEAIKAANKV